MRGHYTKNQLAKLLLRIGLASVLAYAGAAGLLSPNDWVGYLPHFLTARVPGATLLPVFSVAELILAAWLVSGFYRKYAAAAAALMFAGILLANLGVFVITFRDITMVFTALALMVMD